MNKCLGCKYSYFKKVGEVDRLICELKRTPDKGSESCKKYEDDTDFFNEFEETHSLLSKREVK